MSDNKSPDKIYLIEMGEPTLVWCEDPTPGIGMFKEDATPYIKESLLSDPEWLAKNNLKLAEECCTEFLPCEGVIYKNFKYCVNCGNRVLRD